MWLFSLEADWFAKDSLNYQEWQYIQLLFSENLGLYPEAL